MIHNLDKKSIDGVYFNQTCMSFPKTYEVYDENNNAKQIAYVIENETNIQVKCPNENGKVIFELDTQLNNHQPCVEQIVDAIQRWCDSTGR